MPKSKAEKTLKRNFGLYLRLAKIARFYYEKNEYERALQWATLAATFIWQNHPGVFADGRIENIALEIGKKLDTLPEDESESDSFDLLSSSGNSSKKKVLHVATTVYNIGGHTRLIKNWMQAFPAFSHSLVLTNQKNLEVPEFLTATVKENGGDFFILPPKTSLLTKGRILRRAARNGFDYVLLHHHPNDITPTVALAAADCPPTAVINHADHIFWLGTSVTDLVVDFCRFSEKLTKRRRFERKTSLIPFLIDISQSETLREEARRILGITEDEVILITIGSPYKYQPTETHNFFATAKKLLERNPSARLFLIGPSESDAPASEHHERMIFLGLIDNAKLHQTAADIYLDGFPLGGGLASVESVLLNACPVFSYGQLLEFTAARILEFDGLIKNQNTESDYINEVSELIENPILRRAATEKIKAHILYLHDRERFKDYAEKTFGKLDKTLHQTVNLPDSEPQFKDEDVWLTTLHGSVSDKYPLLLDYGWRMESSISFLDLMKLFVTSIKEGDTNLSFAHLRAWAGTMIKKLTAKRNYKKGGGESF